MKFQLPWVSRRYANFLEQTIERLQQERDEQQLRADRLCDEAIAHIGYAPVSTPARNEIKEAEAAVEAAVQHIYDDDTSGMIPPELEAAIDKAAGIGKDTPSVVKVN